MKKKAIIIHGHFYQPPRENPWTDKTEQQDSAYPYHDWNILITEECYRPNLMARRLDENGKICQISDNYTDLNFDFGPTLLSWFQTEIPQIYQPITESAIKSQNEHPQTGAIAQGYNHIIMPLATTKDKETQIIWALKDFKHRFGVESHGFWLPETAVDFETLDILAQKNIKYVILAPTQAGGIKAPGEDNFRDFTENDSCRPYLCDLKEGRTIALFFYHGDLAHQVAFGGLLQNGNDLANALANRYCEQNDPTQPLVHIATDGETFGHHHRFGEMALATCIHNLKNNPQTELTNYASYLQNNPPTYKAQIKENTAWSCAHGVGRWSCDCGCNTGSNYHQRWRQPLREAMDWLRDQLYQIFDLQGPKVLKSPWDARNDYIDLILGPTETQYQKFFLTHETTPSSLPNRIKALQLLEMMKFGMMTFTSCGWFFDDITDLSTIQIIRYADRAMLLAQKFTDQPLETQYREFLKKMEGNTPQYPDGQTLYDNLVVPYRIDASKASSQIALQWQLGLKNSGVDGYATEEQAMDLAIEGQTLWCGLIKLKNLISQEKDVLFSTSVYSPMSPPEERIKTYARALTPEETSKTSKKTLAQMAGNLESLLDSQRLTSLDPKWRETAKDITSKADLQNSSNPWDYVFIFDLATICQLLLPAELSLNLKEKINHSLKKQLTLEQPDHQLLTRFGELAQTERIQIDHPTLQHVLESFNQTIDLAQKYPSKRTVYLRKAWAISALLQSINSGHLGDVSPSQAKFMTSNLYRTPMSEHQTDLMQKIADSLNLIYQTP